MECSCQNATNADQGLSNTIDKSEDILKALPKMNLGIIQCYEVVFNVKIKN